MEKTSNTNLVGKVYSINRSFQKDMPKKPVGFGYFKLGVGMAGDAHSNPDDPARQVSLLAHEDYSMFDKEVPIGTYEENITTEGIEIYNLPIGTQLSIGKKVLLQIGLANSENDIVDYNKMDGKLAAASRIVFAYLRAEGEVSEGDEIRIIKPH